MTLKRAHYAARIYSARHKCEVVVFKRGDEYLYDEARAIKGHEWPDAHGEYIATYSAGKAV